MFLNKKNLKLILPGCALVMAGVVLATTQMDWAFLSSAKEARQLELHRKTFLKYKLASEYIENLINTSAQIINDEFKKISFKKCKGNIDKKHETSVYSPKSNKNVLARNCFYEATNNTIPLWAKATNENKYISWIYAYDFKSQSIRMAPTADTESLYGDNLIFDKFSFNKRALLKAPQIAWSDFANDDINNRGTLVSASKLLLIGNEKRKITVAADFNITEFMNSISPIFMQYQNDQGIKNIFVFVYTKTDGSRVRAGHWASDTNRWSMIKPDKGDILSALESEKEQLIEVEMAAEKNFGEVKSRRVEIMGDAHLCSAAVLTTPKFYIWICTS